MSLPRFQDDRIGLNDYKEVTAAGTHLGVNDLIVKATLASTGTIYLPPVAQMKGKIVTVIATNATAQDCIIADHGDSYVALSVTLDTDNDYAVLFCDGRCWFNLVSN